MQPDVFFKCSPVFEVNRQAMTESQVLVNQGGTDSGKTYAIMQLLFYIACTHNPALGNNEDLVITIVAESIPNLKKGAYRIAKTIYDNSPALQSHVIDWNQTDRMIYFKSGYVMEFSSYMDEQSAKQGKRRYLFVNEAQAISYLIFWQLAKRTRNNVFIDYNPTAAFWAHEKLIGTTPGSNDLGAKVRLIISDHRHNPFLSAEDHFKTENIRDPELWQVYARGRTGNLTGLIFPDWRMMEAKDFNDTVKHATTFTGGLDFGYTSDPTAGVKAYKVGNNIYLDEMCYETGLAPITISQIFKAEGFDDSKVVYCEHDPIMTNDLRRLGIAAYKAKKGPGSIKAGILYLKQFNVFYSERSKNIDIERKRYMWAKNPITGKSTNDPEGGLDHILDASRYATFSARAGEAY